MYITQEEARIHNLIMRFENEYSINDLKEGRELSELSNKLYFREIDFEIAIEGGILEKKEGKYYPTEKLIHSVKELQAKKRNDVNLEEMKKQYIQEFEEVAKDYSYDKITKELIELASKIHWNELPEYEEYMIVNSELYPNKDTLQYYDHFHTLEDLYNELIGKGKNKKSKKGDINLNQEIEIRIYSRRWGHEDRYSIIRTTKGWDVHFHQEKKGGKEGEALINTLRHDFINYPNSLGNFMWHLWNKAENNEMTVEELKYDLERIARWINLCEENTPEGIEV